MADVERTPARLQARMHELDAGEGPLYLGQAPQALQSFARLGEHGRNGALDLLAVDAVVTDAIARLVETPERFEAACREVSRVLTDGEARA